MILFIFLVVLGYLIGSICSAVLVCKACSLPDPRTEGSKNPGATNVLRIAGKQYGALVLLADLLKGLIPVLIARIFTAEPAILGFTALAAVIGHIYPVFFEFKGGKGVATAIGALLGVDFLVGIVAAAIWLLVAKFSRYSSLASITAIGLAPFYSILIVQHLEIFLPLLIMALLILYKHKDNINRLIDKTEPHIKLKENILGDIMEEGQPTEPHLAEKPIATKAEEPVVKLKTRTRTVKIIEKTKVTLNKKKPSKKSDKVKTTPKPKE